MQLEDRSEAATILVSLAYRKTGAIPAAFLVDHLLAAAGEGGWPVQRAAWEAVERRLEFARRDGLVVASRPRGPLGLYATRPPRGAARPYRTLLRGLVPLVASCDCADYLRNALGLCKHVLVVLESLARRPRRWAAALDAEPLPGALRWDPIRPLMGPGDWLARVQLVDGATAAGAGQRLLRSFAADSEDRRVPRDTYADRPGRRLRLVEALLRSVQGKRGSLVDPALHALLFQERDRLERVVGQSGRATRARRALRGLKRRLYPYQVEGVERFLSGGRLLLADDMGLGKTAQAIAAADALLATGRVRRGLLIVPASLKEQWRREWQAFTDTPVAVLEGGRDERRRVYRSTDRGFLVTNYEQVLRDLEDIQAWRPDLVVLDEAQRIKNWATRTAATIKRLRPAYRLVLTGTPMENRLEELASILDWVDDLALEPKWRLLPWHMEAADGRNEVAGARHLDTLRERLSGCLLRRLRQDVLKQLPPRTDTVVPVEITPAQADAHAELDLPIARLAAIGRKRPLTQAEFLRLMALLTTQRIIANGLAQLEFEHVWPGLSRVRRPDPALLAGLSAPKLAELREILTQVVVSQRRKAVVFSQWRRMLQLAHWAAAPLLEDAGLQAAFFTGQESQRRRTQNLVDFHDDPRTAVLFATDAGGVGLNLQRAASCCVNLELPWNPAVLEQRIGRIYRHGQRKPIDVYNLVTQDSIEARIATLVSNKRALFTGLFDGDSNEVRFERGGSFLSRLERLIEPAVVTSPAADEPADGVEQAEDKEVEAVLALADEPAAPSLPAAESARPEAPPAPPAVSLLSELLGQLEIRPKADGGVVIDAPPAAAPALAALFEGLAAALRSGAR